ncbi:MAG TPA: hypothetical protein VF071_00190, partial [Candidatus Limnocylindria bacterium]
MSEPRDDDRHHWLQRSLEMLPGIISWAIIIGPIWLSFSYPWLVAYFVLSFDFYWLTRALWMAASVIVAYRRIRRVLAADWGARLSSLDDLPGRRTELLRRLSEAGRTAGSLGFAVGGGSPDRHERRALEDELRAIEAASAVGEPLPDWRAYVHLALIPT